MSKKATFPVAAVSEAAFAPASDITSNSSALSAFARISYRTTHRYQLWRRSKDGESRWGFAAAAHAAVFLAPMHQHAGSTLSRREHALYTIRTQEQF
ncbi:hypothetical protein BDZ89DRAFT_277141 [Hymenopellis radicata]|nr:hypothetical protein BDZ89DRAFT_277141 [Hymenopellis radicata]